MSASQVGVPVSIRFIASLEQVAAATALKARDAPLAMDIANVDLAMKVYVDGMTKADARRALRTALWAYGQVSWPEDVPPGAYRIALEKVEATRGARPRAAPDAIQP